MRTAPLGEPVARASKKMSGSSWRVAPEDSVLRQGRQALPLAQKTLDRLEHLANVINAKGDIAVAPLQVAALLLERAGEETDDQTIEDLTRAKAS